MTTAAKLLGVVAWEVAQGMRARARSMGKGELPRWLYREAARLEAAIGDEDESLRDQKATHTDRRLDHSGGASAGDRPSRGWCCDANFYNGTHDKTCTRWPAAEKGFTVTLKTPPGKEEENRAFIAAAKELEAPQFESCPVPFPECGPEGCPQCGGTGEIEKKKVVKAPCPLCDETGTIVCRTPALCAGATKSCGAGARCRCGAPMDKETE